MDKKTLTNKIPQAPMHRVFELTDRSGKHDREYYIPSTSTTELLWGCVHYKRLCKFIAPCCNNIYTCRFCHDEKEDHVLNRGSVETVICMMCGCLQQPRMFCHQCLVRFAFSFCSTCKLYDDCEKNGVFHCHKCGICRTGGKGNYVHCDKCNLCIGFRVIKNHICEERFDPTKPIKETCISYEA